MTCWNDVSFEIRLSERTAPDERKAPPGSEKVITVFQNSWSLSLTGTVLAAMSRGMASNAPHAATLANAAMARKLFRVLPFVSVSSVVAPYEQKGGDPSTAAPFCLLPFTF